MKIKICLLIGLPAVGKTTVAERLKRTLAEQSGLHVILVSYDEFIPEDVYVPTKNEKYKADSFFDTSWKGFRNNVLEYIQNIVICLKNGDSSKSTLKDYPKRQDVLCSCFTNNFDSLLTRNMNISEPSLTRNFDQIGPCVIQNSDQNGQMTNQNLSNKDKDSLHLILVDDNMFYRSMRYCYYQLARNYGCGFCQLYLDANLKVILARNEARDYNETVTSETILKMADLIQKPDGAKYSWEKNSISFYTDRVEIENFSSLNDTKQTNNKDDKDPSDQGNLLNEDRELLNVSNDFEKLCQFLCEYDTHLITLPEENVDEAQREADRQLCLKNVLHNSDQIIRKFISMKMDEEKAVSRDKKTLQLLGKQLNEKRKAYLSLLKGSTVFCLYSSSSGDVISDEFREMVIKGFEEGLIT